MTDAGRTKGARAARRLVRVTRVAAIAAIVAAGCARVPPAPPRLTGASVEERFTTAIAARRDRAPVVEGDYSAWLHRAGSKDPPGITMRTRLIAPDAFRLRVDALIGSAVEAQAHRDTLVVVANSIGVSGVTDAGGDTSARQDVGRWLWRVLAADWAPPADAWARGAALDSTWIVRWLEDGDSLAMEVPPTGLPAAVTIRPPGATAIVVTYERWSPQGGVSWPQSVAVADATGRFRVRLAAGVLSLRPRDAGVSPVVRVPAHAERYSRDRLLGWLRRMVGNPAAADTTTGDLR